MHVGSASQFTDENDAQTHKLLNIFGACKTASLATTFAWIFKQKLSDFIYPCYAGPLKSKAFEATACQSIGFSTS